MTTWDLQFTIPTRPLSSNQARGMHWAMLRARVKPWRDMAWVTARNRRVQMSEFTQTPITVQLVIPFTTGRRRDPHNYTGTVVKAVMDGLVAAGVVPDDTPDWVTVLDSELTVHPPADPLVTVRIRPRSNTP